MHTTPEISVVIPAKNEVQNIEPLVAEILSSLDGITSFEIIYVDDGSDDETAQKVLSVQRLYPGKVRLIQHEHSVGQSTSIYNGVIRSIGKTIVTLDADGQNNPADIPKLLKLAERYNPKSDFCISGYRKSRKDTAWKRLQSRIANKVRSYLLSDNTPDTGCGLKVFPKDTFLKLPYFDHMHRYIPALIKRIGGEINTVEVSHRDRQHGTSKYGMWGRLCAGLVDLLGLLWLQKRTRQTNVTEINQ